MKYILLILSVCLMRSAYANVGDDTAIFFDSADFFNSANSMTVVTLHPGGHVDCSECSGPYDVPPFISYEKHVSSQLNCYQSSESPLSAQCTIITSDFQSGFTGLHCNGQADYMFSGSFKDESGTAKQALLKVSGRPVGEFPAAIERNRVVDIDCTSNQGVCSFADNCSVKPN